MMVNRKEINPVFKNFKRNVELGWEGLIVNEVFSDMILACDDAELKVHKVVLASTSPLFKNILKLNANPHPLVYLSGMKYESLQSLVEFMYQGEVNVPHMALESFLEVAEYLGLKGLSENKTSEEEAKLSPKRQKIEGRENDEEIALDDKTFLEIDPNKIHNKGTKLSSKGKLIKKSKYLEEQIENNKNAFILGDFNVKEEKDNFMLDIHENILEPKVEVKVLKKDIENELQCDKCYKQFTDASKFKKHLKTTHESVKYVCSQCGHKAKNDVNLKLHIQSIHEGVPFYCEKCDKKFTFLKNLLKHNTLHGGEQFICDQCDYQSTIQANFKYHVNSVHDNIRYVCAECAFQAKSPGNLKAHVQAIHEGVRYPCGKCSYRATAKTSLKKHMETIHDAIRYPCDQCTYRATQKRYLYKHIDKRHNKIN